MSGLAYIGRIFEVETIPGADFIEAVTVVCGEGGKWRGVVKKDDFLTSSKCVVFLPDAVLPPSDLYSFMEKEKWRVKMKRFKGVPSEVLILPYDDWEECGEDVTGKFHVSKYIKPVPANLQGKAKGNFPAYIPKTDEDHYQRVPDDVDNLIGQPFYITQKMDGSSTTAFKYKGNFGVCSRNWELVEDPKNGYWELALRYNLPEKLPEGYAIQWETCGPKIQGNPMGLSKIEAYAFNVYHIHKHRYLEYHELVSFCDDIGFPKAPLLRAHSHFHIKDIELFLPATYENGKPQEGIVIRSMYNIGEHKPISFKAINLGYEK